jgi:hypothetical protein
MNSISYFKENSFLNNWVLLAYIGLLPTPHYLWSAPSPIFALCKWGKAGKGAVLALIVLEITSKDRVALSNHYLTNTKGREMCIILATSKFLKLEAKYRVTGYINGENH